MAVEMFYDDSADLSLIQGRKVAVIGVLATVGGSALAGITLGTVAAVRASRKRRAMAQAAAERARALPNATVRVWPDGTHSLPMEHPDELRVHAHFLRDAALVQLPVVPLIDGARRRRRRRATTLPTPEAHTCIA